MSAATKPQSDAASQGPSMRAKPLFVPFEWGSDAARAHPDHEKVSALRFVGTAMDVARGVGLLLRVLERESLDDGHREDLATDQLDPLDRQLFDELDRGHLMRLSIASLQLLADEASTRLEHADNTAARRAT
mgnify:CR=1 FL=1